MNDQADIPHDPNGPRRHNDSLGIATERIEVIVSAAERAAAGIIADAEAQARRYLDESRQQTDRALAERTRSLAGRSAVATRRGSVAPAPRRRR